MVIHSLSLFEKVFIGLWLIYNVVLVSDVQPSGSDLHVRISALF